ncbi:MAG: Gfo/Idh/MocA family oxidoreductase [bacterium]
MVKIGTIGAGYWGPNVIRNFSRIKSVKLVKCCDKNKKRMALLKKQYPETKVTENPRSIFEDGNIDAVYIATPAESHSRLVKEALLAGKHVLVEKPLATSSRDAVDLIKTARKKKKVLMAGHVFEYSPVVNKVKECIRKNILGKINYIYSSRTSLGPRAREDVNIVWDYAIHDVSILLYVLNGFPAAVTATGGTYLRRGIEDVVFFSMFFPGNILAHCHTSWYDPLKVRKITFVGNKKMLLYDDLEEKNKIVVFDRGYTPHRGTDKFGNDGLQLYDGGFKSIASAGKEPLRAECEHFLDCILKCKEPRSGGPSAVKVIRVLEAIDKSIKSEGKKIYLRKK